MMEPESDLLDEIMTKFLLTAPTENLKCVADP